MNEDKIDVWKTGFLRYKFRSFGMLNRDRDYNGFCIMAGIKTTLGEGYSFTKRGAYRKAKRTLKYNR